jgi:hypothetical protein
MSRKTGQHVHPLLGNVLVNKFPRRQILGKESVARSRNNRGSCVFCVHGDVTSYMCFLRGPLFPWITILLKTRLLRHATVRRRVIFLPATINLLHDSQVAWILLFGFWRRPAARFRSLRRFLSPPIGITAASSFGIS